MFGVAMKLKPVHFHVELFAVREKNRRATMSIMRLRQEKGANSTFVRMVELLEAALKERNFVALDAARKEGMIQGLHNYEGLGH
jgi:hypothetical protein